MLALGRARPPRNKNARPGEPGQAAVLHDDDTEHVTLICQSGNPRAAFAEESNAMPKRNPRLDRAIDLMQRADARLIHTHAVHGSTLWCIVPFGVVVPAEDIPQLIKRAGLVGGLDGLWPGLPQSYRRPHESENQ